MMPKMNSPIKSKTLYEIGDAKVYLGDCIQVMKELKSGSVDLVFADPPFNNGYKYDVYNDTKTKEEYLEWTRRWLSGLRRVLSPRGSLYIASGVMYQAELKVLMDQVGFHWRDTICWHYTFGPSQRSKLTPSWVAIHYFTMSSQSWTWNPDTIRVPSQRQLVYNDKRAKSGGKVPDNVWVLIPGKYVECFETDSNCILASRICGTFKERTGNHPCQFPESILDRIIRVSSNEGDTILDPFAGSGTTLAATLKVGGRKCLGIELSEAYIKTDILPRLTEILAQNANTARR
jgi:DNA modification methylase